jgi:hypothetical protein
MRCGVGSMGNRDTAEYGVGGTEYPWMESGLCASECDVWIAMIVGLSMERSSQYGYLERERHDTGALCSA